MHRAVHRGVLRQHGQRRRRRARRARRAVFSSTRRDRRRIRTPDLGVDVRASQQRAHQRANRVGVGDDRAVETLVAVQERVREEDADGASRAGAGRVAGCVIIVHRADARAKDASAKGVRIPRTVTAAVVRIESHQSKQRVSERVRRNRRTRRGWRGSQRRIFGKNQPRSIRAGIEPGSERRPNAALTAPGRPPTSEGRPRVVVHVHRRAAHHRLHLAQAAAPLFPRLGSRRRPGVEIPYIRDSSGIRTRDVRLAANHLTRRGHHRRAFGLVRHLPA